MRKTRYFKKKADGVFFSKLPDDDQDPSVEDGRAWREWTFGKDSGQTLGYTQTEIMGYIESCYLKKFDGDNAEELFCIGIQTQDGVDVFQAPLFNKWNSMDSDVEAFALRHDDIDVMLPVTLTLYVGNANKNGFKPCYLNINQNSKPVWPSYKRISGHSFEGVPDAVKTEKMGKMGKTSYDTTERDNFLYEKLQSFMKKVEACGRKENREPTPAEEANPQDDKEDLPF